MVKRILNSFVYSAFFAMLCNVIIEVIVRAIVKFDYSPITPEYIAMFPSVTVAYGVNFLLYGMIGMVFSGFTFIYEKDRICFVITDVIMMVVGFRETKKNIEQLNKALEEFSLI